MIIISCLDTAKLWSLPFRALFARNGFICRMSIVVLLPDVLGKRTRMGKRFLAVLTTLPVLGFHTLESEQKAAGS